MNQSELNFTLARTHDPISSHLAADDVIASGRLAKQRGLVLSAVLRWPSCTAVELAHHMAGYHTEEMTLGWRFHYDYLHKRLKDVSAKGPMRKCKYSGKTVLTWNPKEAM